MADEVYRKTIEPRWTAFVSATGCLEDGCVAVEVSVSSLPVPSLVQTSVTISEGDQLAFDFASAIPLRFNSRGLEPHYEIFSAHKIKYRLALDDARRPPDAQIPALTCRLKSRPGCPAIPVLLRWLHSALFNARFNLTHAPKYTSRIWLKFMKCQKSFTKFSC